MEDSLAISGAMPEKERAPFLNRFVSSSAEAASGEGRSLALIRPKNTLFYSKKKHPDQLEQERATYAEAARQGSFFDEQLKALEPSPYEFRFKFEDAAGRHDYANGDWEAHAMFFNGRRREGSEQATLQWMNSVFNEDYPSKGMLFCIGNMAKRRQTWQLLGVLRVDATTQYDLF
ncbi:hypothetical protein [Paracoccus sp. SM22M-07]|uniref:hypothetical protein n=1 Tax=Paracoccus sp. SM22M-07 TaxID=1520813 RepID=UPI001F0A46C2|nr:hypothetical protein [Paracoccus sp. SM22M-07]